VASVKVVTTKEYPSFRKAWALLNISVAGMQTFKLEHS
jgi:hypothetical protein